MAKPKTPRKKTSTAGRSAKFTAFVNKGQTSIGNQLDAMRALDSGDARAVRKQAARWGITLSEADADALIVAFEGALGSSPGDDRVKGC